jgi:hypothetical protein
MSSRKYLSFFLVFSASMAVQTGIRGYLQVNQKQANVPQGIGYVRIAKWISCSLNRCFMNSQIKSIGIALAILASTISIGSWFVSKSNEQVNKQLSYDQISEFEKKFNQVEVGMTRKQVKSILGETNYRPSGSEKESMEELVVWAYPKYRRIEDGKWRVPAVFFESYKDVSRTDFSASALEMYDKSCDGWRWLFC